MGIRRRSVAFIVVVTGLSAQATAPYFTRDSVLPVWGKHPEPLLPNELVSIYGRYLAPAQG